ncbi:unnamed protein product [Rotaria sp. Silwood2]|nr:unnamed protein product [Rotaria sp. Silwood2]
MQDSLKNIYTAKTWFQLKCEDPHTRHLWIKSRVLYTFKPQIITALYLFEYRMANLEQGRSQISSQRAFWSHQVHCGVRRLFGCIATRWIPSYLSQTFRTSSIFHKSLTYEGLCSVPQIFGNKFEKMLK